MNEKERLKFIKEVLLKMKPSEIDNFIFEIWYNGDVRYSSAFKNAVKLQENQCEE